MADDVQFDPRSMSVEDAARLLGVERAWLDEDVALGAPRNADGTLDLVAYAAWLNKADGGDSADD